MGARAGYQVSLSPSLGLACPHNHNHNHNHNHLPRLYLYSSPLGAVRPPAMASLWHLDHTLASVLSQAGGMPSVPSVPTIGRGEEDVVGLQVRMDHPLLMQVARRHLHGSWPALGNSTACLLEAGEQERGLAKATMKGRRHATPRTQEKFDTMWDDPLAAQSHPAHS
jgi:hypothetical protein